MIDSTITIPTQEYQSMSEVINLQHDMIEQLKKELVMRNQLVTTLESLIDCKNSLIEYYEIK